MSILLYGCTAWTLIKCMEKKLDGNYTRMLWAVLNKSWKQHFTKQQLYGHRPPITKTIQVRSTRHAGHCWRSKDKLISNILLWAPSHRWAKAGWPGRTDIQQLCANMGYRREDLPRAMDDRDGRSVLTAWHDNDDEEDIHLSRRRKNKNNIWGEKAK